MPDCGEGGHIEGFTQQCAPAADEGATTPGAGLPGDRGEASETGERLAICRLSMVPSSGASAMSAAAVMSPMPGIERRMAWRLAKCRSAWIKARTALSMAAMSAAMRLSLAAFWRHSGGAGVARSALWRGSWQRCDP